MTAGYMSLGKVGRRARYACSRIRYCGGIMLLAKSSDIGMIATVPFRVPVALLGYSEAIGFGWSCVWHTSNTASLGNADTKYDELAYRIAKIDKKLKTKYCNLESRIRVFGRDMVTKTIIGWHKSARSRQVLNMLPKSQIVGPKQTRPAQQ
jgi:hypothetical protein